MPDVIHSFIAYIPSSHSFRSMPAMSRSGVIFDPLSSESDNAYMAYKGVRCKHIVIQDWKICFLFSCVSHLGGSHWKVWNMLLGVLWVWLFVVLSLPLGCLSNGLNVEGSYNWSDFPNWVTQSWPFSISVAYTTFSRPRKMNTGQNPVFQSSHTSFYVLNCVIALVGHCSGIQCT